MKKRLNSILLFGILMTITITVNAQLVMLKDIETTVNKAGSDPSLFTELNGYLYFAANEPSIGVELWRTDGTLAGTELVKDIRTGSSSSNPSSLFVYKGKLYFQADDGVTGKELWKTDGTENGTELVMDIYTGSSGGWGGGNNSSSPQKFIIFNDTLFFQARDNNGTELWKSDGSDSGTVMVKNIFTGSSGKSTNSSYPQNFIIMNGVLYFQAASNNNGTELWKSDGTTAGTQLVTNINAGTANSDPKLFVELNNLLYFVANDGTNGDELWESNGTALGTVLVKDINTTAGAGSSIQDMIKFNNNLYFQADNGTGGELWTSNGTAAGTKIVKDINTGTGYSGSFPSTLTVFNGKFYFAAANDGFDYELWVSDGTSSGTKLFKDLFAAAASSPGLFTVVNNKMFFVAQNTGVGNELWRTDGTDTGTVMVKDINPGTNPSNPQSLTTFKNEIYFSADNGINTASSGLNREPWKSNGTAAGTVVVKEIVSGTQPSYPSQLVRLKNNLYFTANTIANGTELYTSDGTTTGTKLFKDIWIGKTPSDPKSLTNINDVLFFSADDGGAKGRQLWRSDGTLIGTKKVKDIGLGSSNPSNLCNVNGILYFSADDGVKGNELWKSDGTAVDTVKDIFPGYGTIGPNASNPYGLINVNDTLFFIADDGIHGSELWKSDGTSAGTFLVKDIRPGTDTSNIRNLFNYNGLLLFQADDGTNGTELWKSDGTTAGTVMVKDIFTGKGGWGGGAPNSSNPQYFCELNGKVYFQATCYNTGNNTGTELWQTDGTTAGTLLLKDINTSYGWGGASSSTPQYLTKVGNEIFFAATTKAEGNELWKTNGTAAGTVLFRNINPGSKSSNPNNLLADSANNLYFVASDGIHGSELWKSENNLCGKTQMVGETNTGSGGSGPTNLCMVKTIVYLAGSNAAYSTELWKYSPQFSYVDTATFFYEICNGDSVLIAGKYYKDAKTYRDSLQNAKGCDSLILTTIVVHPVYSKTRDYKRCIGDSVKVGSKYIKTSGTVNDNYKTYKGCDSNFVYNLLFSPKPPTPVITQTGLLQLTSNAPAGNQWYDDKGPIAGETKTTLTNAKKVKFYVIVTIDSCSSDPSNKINPQGINEKLGLKDIDIYPNPVSDKLVIEYTGNNTNGYIYNINNVQGKTMLQGKFTEQRNEIDVSSLSRGVYFVKIIFNDQIGLVKILKD